MIPVKGGNIRESILGVSRFRAEEPEGESCEFDRLGGCGGRTGCVSGIVSSFCATFMYKVFSSELQIIIFILIFKVLNDFLNFLDLILIRKYINRNSYGYTES